MTRGHHQVAVRHDECHGLFTVSWDEAGVHIIYTVSSESTQRFEVDNNGQSSRHGVDLQTDGLPTESVPQTHAKPAFIVLGSRPIMAAKHSAKGQRPLLVDPCNVLA